VIFSLAEAKEVKRAKAGFIVSLIGAILILIVDIYMYYVIEILEEAAGFELFGFAETLVIGLFAWGLLCAILVLVGAALMWTGKTTAGGILALLFSIFSIGSLAWGGFVIGMILGIVGGALGIAKK